MANVTYGTPPGGGYQVTVPGAETGGVAGGGMPSQLKWMMDLARRKADQEAAMRALQLKAAQQQFAPKMAGVDPMARRLQENALQRDVAQTQAMTGRAPTKYVDMGPNTTGPFQVADTENMTGAQRAVFAPQSATYGGHEQSGLMGGGFSNTPPPQQSQGGETIAEMANRMYGDWRQNAANREAQDYGRRLAAMGGGSLGGR